MTKQCTCWHHVTNHLIISNDNGLSTQKNRTGYVSMTVQRNLLSGMGCLPPLLAGVDFISCLFQWDSEMGLWGHIE